MTTRQLIVFAVVVIVLTLTLAWLVERRTVLSLRNDLENWGGSKPPLPPQETGGGMDDLRPPNAPIVGWDDDEIE